MRPTRRGLALLAVAAAAIAMGTQFGQPGLNAVAGPLLVAIAAGAGQLLLAGTPTVERAPARRGMPGDTQPIELTVAGSGIATIADTLPDGLDGEATVRRSLPATVTHEVTYAKRGEWTLGPVSVTVTDALGLVRRQYTVDATATVLVYPRVYRMGGPGALARTLGARPDDRQSFDRLREYVPGDSLRDIHWKSSAKRDTLFVREYAERGGEEGLHVAGIADSGAADAMAAAVATIALAALGSGESVAITVPGGRVDPGHSEHHRTRILETLALTPAGDVPDADEADVLVSATEDGVMVTSGGQVRPFDALTTGGTDPMAEVAEP